MLDKAKLGKRYTCYQCGTKFYDLNRPLPTCPECSADQNDSPVAELKLSSKRGSKAKEPVLDTDDLDADADDDDDDDGLFDDVDGDDDDDDDDDE